MRFSVPKLNISPQNFLRHCGYLEIRNPHKNNEISHARGLNAGRNYPRFHIYIEAAGNNISINIHLDAKQPSYEGTSAHSGEYEGKLIEDETTRIQKISEQYVPVLSKEKIGFSKKSFLEKIMDLLS